MKKKELIYLVSVLIFSFLFYKQKVGLNYFLFSLLVSTGWALVNPLLLHDKLWLLLATGSIVSGFSVWLYGSDLALWACIVTLGLLSAVSYSRGATLLLAVVYSLFSFVSAPVRMLIETISFRSKREDGKTTKLTARIGAGLIVFLLVFLFFVLYQQSNSLFKQFTQNIDLSWINIQWFLFTLLGAIILYGYYYPTNIISWHEGDLSKLNKLNKDSLIDQPYSFLKRTVNPSTEYSYGLLLLALLNVLLLMVNIVDIIYLYFHEGIPQGMTYSEFVHQGTGNLILSIIIAILILMYLFRGRQHFTTNPWLKRISLLWVAQNLVLISSSAFKNYLYISEYALTYKRTGVYIYLLLAIIGLLFTCIKLLYNKSNWYLLRRNSIAFVSVLVISSLFNWDGIITRHNLKRSVNIDYDYLIDLGYYPLPILLAQEALSINVEDLQNDDKTKDIEQVKTLHHKLFRFIDESSNRGWKAHSIMRSLTHKRLLHFIKEQKINCLFIPAYYEEYNQYLSLFAGTQAFELINGGLSNETLPAAFINAKYLNLGGNSFSTTKAFAMSRNLEFLDLSSNNLNDISHLSLLPVLRTLNVRGNTELSFEGFKGSTSLEELDISENNLKSYAFLSSLPKLQNLSMENMTDADWKSMPEMSNLSAINISGNRFFGWENTGKSFSINLASITELKASDCNLSSLLFLTNYADILNRFGKYDTLDLKNSFPLLEVLDFRHNQLTSADALEYFTALKEANLGWNELKKIGKGKDILSLTKLNLTNNKLKKLDGLQRFVNLSWLDVSTNQISDLRPLMQLKHLEFLDLSHCDISDFSSLSHNKKLNTLRISVYDNSTLKSLQTLNQLEELHIIIGSEVSADLLSGMKALRKIFVYNANDLQFEAIHKTFCAQAEIKRIESYETEAIEF